MKAEKRMRSATEPATSATVMTANVIWYIMNSASGMVLANGLIDVGVMPARKMRSRLPRNGPSPVKVSE